MWQVEGAGRVVGGDAGVPRKGARALLGLRATCLWGLVGLGAAGVVWASEEEAGFRYQATVEVQQAAPFVQLALTPGAHAHSQQAGLNDLRLVDSQGQRVPFALLDARPQEHKRIDQFGDAALYPLPARPQSGKAWASPVEVVVQGDRISVKRLPDTAQSGKTTGAAIESPGWLFDLGERAKDGPAPRALRLSWSGPLEFSAGFGLETSDDLLAWRGAGGGQVMALTAAMGPLTQPLVTLPGTAGRFVRLVWLDAANAPLVTGAKVVTPQTRSQAVDPPAELVFSATPEPKGKAALDDLAPRALHFDLGGALPLVQLDLALPAGTTRVAPVRLQGRLSADEPWRDLANAVFYRLERGSEASVSPAAAVAARVRFVRVVPDSRAALLDAASTRLKVQASLGSLVFAAQGQAPYRLLAGHDKAPASALPVATLVPTLDEERARFGRASLGGWTEVAAVAKAQQDRQAMAALRPWLLWAVLLAGVAGLGFMVWRLARSG